MRHDFLHSLILSLSNSPTPDLTTMLTLTCTLLVKSGTHSLYLFSQLPLTCALLNAVYRLTSAIRDPISIAPQLRWILVGLWPLPTGGDIKKYIYILKILITQ